MNAIKNIYAVLALIALCLGLKWQLQAEERHALKSSWESAESMEAILAVLISVTVWD